MGIYMGAYMLHSPKGGSNKFNLLLNGGLFPIWRYQNDEPDPRNSMERAPGARNHQKGSKKSASPSLMGLGV